jgi:hypothetical protein
MNRPRASDPDRRNPTLDHVKLLYVGLASMVLGLVLANVPKGGPSSSLIMVGTGVWALGILLTAVFVIWTFVEFFNHQQASTIVEKDYLDAPPDIRRTMARIYRAARSVRRGEAHTRGFIDGTELQRVVYSAAQQAVLSSELSVDIRELTLSRDPEDRRTVAEAEKQIDGIRKNIKAVEARFSRAADTAKQLSEEVIRPERERENAAKRAQKQAIDDERYGEARSRLTDATERAKLQAQISEDGTSLENHITGMRDGFQEVAEISKRVERGPVLPNDSAAPEGESDAPGSRALKIAKSAATQGMRLSGKAARSAAKKLKEKRGEK